MPNQYVEHKEKVSGWNIREVMQLVGVREEDAEDTERRK